jgi:hypothetical protein
MKHRFLDISVTKVLPGTVIPTHVIEYDLKQGEPIIRIVPELLMVQQLGRSGH